MLFRMYNTAHDSLLCTRNSSGDETANVNFLYDDIAHVGLLQSTAPSPNCTTRRSYSANTKISTGSQASKHNGKVKLTR